MKVCLIPNFRGPDEGDGGIRRIVEAQRRYMPDLGFEFVDEIAEADLVASHAGNIADVPPNIPWIAHTHGLYWREYNWARWCHALNRQVITAVRRADHVTAPSEWVANVFRRGMWIDPTVLYHAVDPEDWMESDRKVGDYVLWNKTRVDPVCDSTPMNQVAARLPNVRFISTYGTETDNVKVIGTQAYEVGAEFIKSAGVYLCTTRETMGIGTLEAMAAGVPVVAWAWGGQREFIQHGVNGWLARPGDADGLAEGIMWARENRDSVSQAGFETILKYFTWGNVIQQYADLYRSVETRHRELFSGPRVSVIVPSYNLARFLPDTLDSLLGQTSGDWEAIIVDDDSPDNTAQVAEEYGKRDERIRYIKNDENLYLAGALNEGVKVARGRYILALDADNMIASTTLEELGNALDKDRSVDIAYGAAQFVLEDGRSPDAEVSPDGVSRWPTDFVFANQIQHRNQIPSTALYRRDVWERSGGYRRRYRTAEDAEFWTRVTSLGFAPAKVTNRVTLIYRNREGSMSRTEDEGDWTSWFPWSRRSDLTPFGVDDAPPPRINDGLSWNVASYEPVKVSVIIPVGPGHQDYLIDALDSVAGQTFQDWECIVINDTGEPLHVPHPWAKVLDTGGRRGPAHARNMGIEASIGAVFLPLDADDYLQPDAMALMLEAFDQFGGVVYSQWYDEYQDGSSTVYDPPEWDAMLLLSKGAIHAVTALYPRAGWEAVGGFDEGMRHWEDWDFQIRLALEGICGTKVPAPLFTYRKDTGYRREANQATFNDGRDETLSKWSAAGITRETIAMGCSGCPGGGGGTYNVGPPPIKNAAPLTPTVVEEGYSLVQYNGKSTTTVSYTGSKSRKKYRFGQNPGHQIKYVFDDDLDGLLALSEGGSPIFAIVNQSDPRKGGGSPQIQASAPLITQREPSIQPQPEPVPVGANQPERSDGTQLAKLAEGGPENQRHLTQPSMAVGNRVNGMTTKDVEAIVDELSLEESATMLAQEKSGQNRKGVTSILQDAVRAKV